MDWASKVNWIDVLFLIIILRSIYTGSQKGFFTEFFNVLGVGIAIVLGIHFYSPAGNILLKYLFIPLNISNLIAFLTIWFLAYFLFHIIEGLVKKLLKIEILPGINKAIDRIGGPVIGLCKGIALSVFIYIVFLLIPVGYIVNSAKVDSLSGNFFSKTVSVLYAKTVNMIPSASPVDISLLLEGAKPLEFKMIRPKKKDKLDEVLN